MSLKQVYLLHFESCLLALIKSSLPVFVAASLSRAALSLIFLLPSTIPSFAAAFAYALCICHTLGTYVAIKLPSSRKLFKFYVSLVTEIAGFAWKEAAMLLIYQRGGSVTEVILYSFLTWCGVVVCTVIVVCASAYITRSVVHLPHHAEVNLSVFRGEVFSLSIAYTFTFLVAYAIYWNQRGVDTSLYITDDEHDTSNDDNQTSNLSRLLPHCLFLLYAVGLTYLAAIVQSYDSTLFKDILVSSAGTNNIYCEHVNPTKSYTSPSPPTSGTHSRCRSNDPVSALQETLVTERENIDTEKCSSRVTIFTGDDGYSTQPLDENGLADRGDWQDSSSTDWYEGREGLSGRGGRLRAFVCLCGGLFSWDAQFVFLDSLHKLLQTTQGYMVGSAWYVWSVHTFESVAYLPVQYEILGWAGFALLMTALMTLMMSRSAYKLDELARELEWAGREQQRAFVRRTKRQQVKVAASRITVGWIWEEFLSTIFLQIRFSSASGTDSRATSAVLKCAVALLITGLGCGVQYYYAIREPAHESGDYCCSGTAVRDEVGQCETFFLSERRNDDIGPCDVPIALGCAGERTQTDKCDENASLTEALLRN